MDSFGQAVRPRLGFGSAPDKLRCALTSEWENPPMYTPKLPNRMKRHMATKPHAHPSSFMRTGLVPGLAQFRALFGSRAAAGPTPGGVVTLGGDDFAQFEACMKSDKK